ncbi:MAG: hypothetical protein GY878_00545 [Fuerstiella sp.]|nr:hypothetical protein [Fuerstiella sp.]
MKSEILTFLTPVRSRLRAQSVVATLGTGAVIGGVICILMALARAASGFSVANSALAVVFLTGVGVAAIIGFVLKRSWHEAAAAIDHHYRLKDRTVTALEFTNQSTTTALQQLQVQDAASHLGTVNAREVVPIGAPRRWGWAVLSVTAALTLMLWPLGSEIQADVSDHEGIGQAAIAIQTELDEMEQLAEESGIEELTRLVLRLREDVKQLEMPETDVRESLVTISQMQQKMQEMMAQMNVAGMDAQLSALAEAMEGAQAFKAAAEALEKGDLEKAAEELENVNAEDMDRRESRPTSEKLSKLAAAVKKQGLSKMGETLLQLSEAVKAGDSESTRENSRILAQEVKRHSLAKSLHNMLTSKSDKLGASKTLCSANSNSNGEGQGAGEGLNLAEGQSDRKSNSASQKAGAKSAGNIDGEKTKLESQRQMANLTGQMGEGGDSDYETTTSPEAQEQAQRQAREAFAKYQKMSETVLESEPIPLGHRQTIRKYFELIRPTSEIESISKASAVQ